MARPCSGVVVEGLPTLGSLVGTARLIVVSVCRMAVIFGLPVGTYAAITKGNVWDILGAFAAWFFVLLGLSIAAARNRVIVGDFAYVSSAIDAPCPAASPSRPRWTPR